MGVGAGNGDRGEVGGVGPVLGVGVVEGGLDGDRVCPMRSWGLTNGDAKDDADAVVETEMEDPEAELERVPGKVTRPCHEPAREGVDVPVLEGVVVRDGLEAVAPPTVDPWLGVDRVVEEVPAGRRDSEVLAALFAVEEDETVDAVPVTPVVRLNMFTPEFDPVGDGVEVDRAGECVRMGVGAGEGAGEVRGVGHARRLCLDGLAEWPDPDPPPIEVFDVPRVREVFVLAFPPIDEGGCGRGLERAAPIEEEGGEPALRSSSTRGRLRNMAS
ncbi:hypothetical protein HDU93_007678 [Gonapodya sp. JEL0774]|nr:hypothetical protein HDU93_007678 [Gonapodya sp. JEL0774]